MLEEIEQLSVQPVCLKNEEKVASVMLFQDLVPHVTVEHKEVMFYTHKTRSLRKLQNPMIQLYDPKWRYAYHFSRDEAIKEYEEILQKGFLLEHGDRERKRAHLIVLQEYGVQEHSAVIPVYTLQYVSEKSSLQQRDVREKRFICPTTLDVEYNILLKNRIMKEERFTRTLGHQSVKNFRRSRTAFRVMQHFSMQEFLQVEQEFQDLREHVSSELKDTLLQYLNDHDPHDNIRNNSTADFYVQALMRSLNERLYGWFDDTDHAQSEYPLAWFIGIHVSYDDVEQYMQEEMERLIQEVKTKLNS